MTSFKTVSNGYANMWDSCEVCESDRPQLTDAVNRIMALRNDFKMVEHATGVPWFWVAASNYRESNLDLSCYAGNGQKLNMVTTIVPIGRGPFANFTEGCMDAYGLQRVDGVPLIHRSQSDWTIEFMLFAAEELNGEGYTLHHENSPYNWAGTNHEQPGLFVSDGHWDAGVSDKRLGVAAIIKGLMEVDNTIILSRSPKVVHMAPAPGGGSSAPFPAPTMTPAPPFPAPTPIPPGTVLPQPGSGGPFPVPTVGTVVAKPILSIPGGPNIVLDLEHNVESGLNLIPTIAMFVPQLQIVTPFIPLIRAALSLAEDETKNIADGGGVGDFGSIIETHFQSIFDELRKANIVKFNP